MEVKTKKKRVVEEPRDMQKVVSILKEMGVDKFENNVPHMLMEFVHSYTQEILEEARAYAEYAGKEKKIESTDLQLAIESYNEKYFSRPLPLTSLRQAAIHRNQSTKIPAPPRKCAIDVDFPASDNLLIQNEFHIDSEDLQLALQSKSKPSVPKPAS